MSERSDPAVVYAMKVRKALADGNFRRYFSLATMGPHCTKHLCEIFEPRMRMLALVCMTKYVLPPPLSVLFTLDFSLLFLPRSLCTSRDLFLSFLSPSIGLDGYARPLCGKLASRAWEKLKGSRHVAVRGLCIHEEM